MPSQNIYYNFDVGDLNKISDKTARAKIRSVIMGISKSGKTIFINRLCNKNHSTGILAGSTTEDVASFPK